MSAYKLLAGIARRMPKTVLRLRYFKNRRSMMVLNGKFSDIPNLATYVFRSAVHNASNPRWSKMADKYAVREEVAKIIGEEYLIPLYGHWERPEDIDFDSLPEEYILKTNNGCGTNIFVTKDSKISRAEIVSQLRKDLDFPYAELSGQLHYSHIHPCVLAEKLMKQGNGKSLTDYKIHCVNGRPQVIFVFSDREEVNHFDFKVSPYTLKWQIIPKDTPLHAMKEDAPVAPGRPAELDKMLELASRLSAGEEYVRVDFYIIDGHIYFGEMTYTPDVLFHPAFNHYQGVMSDILARIGEDRRSGVSSNTF